MSAPSEPTGGGDTAEPALRSAEEWLAARGITRDPIRVRPGPADPAGSTDAGGNGAVGTSSQQSTGSGGLPVTGPPPSVREVAQLATESPPAIPGEAAVVGIELHGAEGNRDGSEPATLGDEVARAMTFIRASTGQSPASSGRLRRKLAQRDVPAAAIRAALDRAREVGMVDDVAMATAIADEARAKGHAPRRIRSDLRTREFDPEVVEATLARFNDRDPEALAFDVAQGRARSLRSLDAETAFRRLVGYLARRGHNEHVARKVARQVIFDDRDSDRVAGH